MPGIRQTRKEGSTQIIAAAKSGISERSGRAIEQGVRRKPARASASVRTRPDPFLAVWDNDLLPLLERLPMLQPITLREHLQEKYRDSAGDPLYADSLLRTLQRRVKVWKAVHGPAKDVMFRQTPTPGRLGLSDFTQLKGTLITVKGRLLEHLLYHFRLAFSHWRHIKVILGGESYTR